MQPNGLPRCCRLHLKDDFKEIIQGGTRLQCRNLVLWYRKAEDSSARPARFAVVVSHKLGPAVLRNRAKRLLREAFRLNKKHLVVGTDVILSPRGWDALGNVQAAQQALKSLFGQAGLLNTLLNHP